MYANRARAQSSTNINSYQETRFPVKPATLLIPIDSFPFLLVEEFYGTRYQSDSFSLMNVGFQCLRSFFITPKRKR